MGDQPRSTIGRYEVVERLAVGGMAELFVARARGAHGFERKVVIKKILPKLASNESFVGMFIDEARITSQLHHAKIVQVLELDNHDDELFIAMEYVEGIDVLELLRRSKKAARPVPPELAAHIAHEVLDALDYAHRAVGPDGAPLGIIHRDVSPGNVLISKVGDVKLTDFGIARAVERQQRTQAGTLKGKYSYMSPELIAQKPLDARSDLFSVGVLLSEMLMGTRLFAAPSDLDLLLAVRDVDLSRLERYGQAIPDDLRPLLHRALTRLPDDRWPDAGSFRDAVADWLFATGRRVAARDLAAHVESLSVGDGVVSAEVEDIATISGPVTRASQQAARKLAQIGRGLYETATPALGVPVTPPTADGVPRRDPDAVGHFGEISPMALLFRLAQESKTGLLVVDRPEVLKAVYLEVGQPSMVSSNRASESFGQHLIATGALTAEELARATEVLPHFDGRMGDTLAGLGLMSALETVRALGELASRRIGSVCAWQDGRYRWYAGERRPDSEMALDLDACRVLGTASQSLPKDMVYRWAQSVGQRAPRRRRGAVALHRFGVAGLAEVHAELDGVRTIEALAFPRIVEADQLTFLRSLYLLIQCGLAAV